MVVPPAAVHLHLLGRLLACFGRKRHRDQHVQQPPLQPHLRPTKRRRSMLHGPPSVLQGRAYQGLLAGAVSAGLPANHAASNPQQTRTTCDSLRPGQHRCKSGRIDPPPPTHDN